MKQTLTIPIYHIDDDEEWRIIVKDVIKRLPLDNIEYIPIAESFEKAVMKITENGVPGLAVLDLRLDEPLSEFRTVVELHRVRTLLSKSDIEIIILSGHVEGTLRYFLVESGFADKRIFSKGIEFVEGRVVFSETISSLVLQMRNGATNKTSTYNSITSLNLDTSLSERINRLESTLLQELENIKKGQAFLYHQLSPENQKIIINVLEELKQGNIKQRNMEKVLFAVSNTLNNIVRTDTVNNQKVKQSLDSIYSAVNASTELQQQFELVLPIIPFLLEYKISLGGGVDLGATWNELLSRISSGKNKNA